MNEKIRSPGENVPEQYLLLCKHKRVYSLTVSQTLKGSSRLKGFQCHWGGVRLQAGGGPGRVRSRAWYGNTRYQICTAKSSGTKFVL